MAWCVPRLFRGWHALECATTCHGMPWYVPRHASVCATACLDVCRSMARRSPWHAHEQFKPRLVACPSAAHGMPWCVPRLAMACPWARPTEVSGLPMGCHGFPRHALVCAMACHGMPWCVTWPAHGVPRLAMVCATTSHARAKLIFARANLPNCASKFIL